MSYPHDCADSNTVVDDVKNYARIEYLILTYDILLLLLLSNVMKKSRLINSFYF